MRVKVVIEYDGKEYSGWQRQINSNSVQETIESCLYKLTGRKIVIHGAGRTDAGVHAFGQVFHFDDDVIPPERYEGALNSKLPYDIRVISSEKASNDFHSRFDATGKRYQYKIINQKKPLVIGRNYMWRVYKPLDVDKMRKASDYILGEHDFACFMASRSFVHTTIRRIDEVLVERKDEYVTIDIKGNGFLRSMVRIIAGTLVEIGTDDREIEDMKKIIISRKRLRAGITAPAGGLYLMEVFYDK